MLVYHPAFDLYNCIFRMLQLLKYSKEDEVQLEKLRIWDFYLTFPSQVSDIVFPAHFFKLKQVFKDKHNPYEELSNPKQIFERMKSFQLTALKCLASYGFIDTKLLAKNIIKKTDKELPELLEKQLENLSVEKSNIIKLVTGPFYELPLYGQKGLKARTGLIEYKYDPK